MLDAGDAFAFVDGLHRGHYKAGNSRHDHRGFVRFLTTVANGADIPRRTVQFTLSAGRRAKGLDNFTYQPWFLQPGYLSGLSPTAERFYARYMAEYGEEMRARHEEGGAPKL